MPVAGDFLDYDDVMAKFDTTMEWLARTYVHAMNCIHYMHDKYFYERLEMALHDRDILQNHGIRHRRPFGGGRQPRARSSTARCASIRDADRIGGRLSE